VRQGGGRVLSGAGDNGGIGLEAGILHLEYGNGGAENNPAKAGLFFVGGGGKVFL